MMSVLLQVVQTFIDLIVEAEQCASPLKRNIVVLFPGGLHRLVAQHVERAADAAAQTVLLAVISSSILLAASTRLEASSTSIEMRLPSRS